MFGPTFNDYYRKALEEVRAEVLRAPSAKILESEVDALSDMYFRRYALQSLEFNPSDIYVDIKKEVRRVPAEQREAFYQSEGDLDWEYETAVISLPIKQNRNLDWIQKLNGSSRYLDGFEDDIVYNREEISYSFDTKWYGSKMDEDQIANQVNTKSARLIETLTQKNNNIKFEDNNFMHSIKELVSHRKAQLAGDVEKQNSLAQKIKIPIRQKTPSSVRIPEESFANASPRAKAHGKNHDGSSQEKKFDVFISHASEDKEAFVKPLAEALQSEGLSVWYDDFQLKWGDSLRDSIALGLGGSKYGIVVLSQSFLSKKKWTEHELDGLFALEDKERKVILPIWHNVSRDDIVAYSPSLADRLAKRSERDDIPSIVQEIKRLADNF